MSVHTEYVLKTIYYSKTVNDNLHVDTYGSMHADYGYPLKGLRSSCFPAFCKEPNKIFIYDYESLQEDKYFNKFVCIYYINRVVRQSLTNNIENAIKEYIAKRAAKIELGFKNLNGTTFLQDMILRNVAILNQIYIAAQEDSILKELNGTCQIIS
jgi:hypothetical protein